MDRPLSLVADGDTDAVRGFHSRKPLVEIGKGQCGTVFALPGSVPSDFAAVAKIPNVEEKNDRLVNDCAIHRRVLDAFQGCDPALAKDINIPRVATCVSADMESFWSQHDLQYHDHLSTHGFDLVSARVFAVPMPFRHAIVDSLCPPAIREMKQEYLDMPKNQNCLVRMYLGRRESNKTQIRSGIVKL